MITHSVIKLIRCYIQTYYKPDRGLLQVITQRDKKYKVSYKLWL